MLGCEVKHMPVCRIRQERAPLLPRPQQPRLEGDIAQGGNVLTDFQAPVRVQVVQDPIKLLELPEMRSHVAKVPAEILTGSRRAEVPDHLTRGYGERGNQGARAVADVFEF